MNSVLICPICHQALTFFTTPNPIWKCDNQHSYDHAKQGYVNLHIVQHKHSKNPGDTPQAVQARREFLKAGFYAPLQKKVVEIIKDLTINTVVDIGCGEGYYTQAMTKTVTHMIGIDIAKNAVQIASKQSQQNQQNNITWVVGTGSHIPVQSQTIDMCTSLFSPIPKQEILRILKQNGYLLIATPAPNHLYNMRQALFDDVKHHQPEKFLQQLTPEFNLVQKFYVSSDLILDNTYLKHLIAMTPYAYKAKALQREQLEQSQQFNVTAEFYIYLLQKTI